MEFARLIKAPEEMTAIELSMDVCDIAVDRLRQSLRPGITENQAWSVLHDTNIIHDGEWIECRLLASGPRTNPWFQESSNRQVQSGELDGSEPDRAGTRGLL